MLFEAQLCLLLLVISVVDSDPAPTLKLHRPSKYLIDNIYVYIIFKFFKENVVY